LGKLGNLCYNCKKPPKTRCKKPQKTAKNHPCNKPGGKNREH